MSGWRVLAQELALKGVSIVLGKLITRESFLSSFAPLFKRLMRGAAMFYTSRMEHALRYLDRMSPARAHSTLLPQRVRRE